MTKYLLHIIAFLLLHSWSYTQELETTFSKSDVLIGEQVELIQKITLSHQIDSFPAEVWQTYIPTFTGELATDSTIYPLEIITEARDSLFTEKNSFIAQRTYRVIAWDSAYLVIPPTPAILGDSALYFPPALLEVNYPESVQQSDEIKDIYELFEHFSFDENKWLYLLILLISLVLILTTIIWIYYKRKRKKSFKIIPSLSPIEKAMTELDKLEKGQLIEDNLKEFYFMLSFILRTYLHDVLSFNAKESTTVEIAYFLKNKKVKKEHIEEILTLLRQADLVKFAKFRPSLEDSKASIEQVKEIIMNIEKMYVKKQ